MFLGILKLENDRDMESHINNKNTRLFIFISIFKLLRYNAVLELLVELGFYIEQGSNPRPSGISLLKGDGCREV